MCEWATKTCFQPLPRSLLITFSHIYSLKWLSCRRMHLQTATWAIVSSIFSALSVWMKFSSILVRNYFFVHLFARATKAIHYALCFGMSVACCKGFFTQKFLKTFFLNFKVIFWCFCCWYREKGHGMLSEWFLFSLAVAF